MRHAFAALALLGASTLGALAVAASVSAHAEYESSTPAAGEVVATAPASVTVNFNGEMQKTPGTYALTVTSPSGIGVT
ncbi:MAG: copper resistance protein CopC, partial [Chloroflexi bacterium]|nr:copper resistance protein CopC [Chloroflexota bacterium]